MDILLNILSLIGPIILIWYINTLQNISMQIKMILWTICAVIFILALYLIIKDYLNKREKVKREALYNRLNEKPSLFNRKLPEILIDRIKRNPSISKLLADGIREETQYKYHQAIEIYKKCSQISENSNFDKATLNILLGQDYFFLSKPSVAEKYFREALQQVRNIEDENVKSLAKAHILAKLGNTYHLLGKPDDALDYYRQSLELYRKLAYGKGESENLRNIGTVYAEINEQNRALKYQEDALEADKKMLNRDGIAIDMANIGSVYHALERYEEAEQYYQGALEIFQEIENQEGIAHIYNLQGLKLNSLGETEEAINQYKEALKINRKLKYFEGITTNLANIGLAYITLGKSRNALKYYREAVELFDQMEAQPRKEILRKIIKVIQEEKTKDHQEEESLNEE